MREYLLQHRSHHYPTLIRRWSEVAKQRGLILRRFARQDGYWLYYARSKKAKARPAVYLSAGTHGDEPGSTEGLLHWIQNVDADLLASVDVMIFPCMNPWGLVANSRYMESGQDLNRSFHDDALPAIAGWRSVIEGRRFELALCLHEDYDAQGLYIYELKQRAADSWATALVTDVGLAIPPDPRNKIDGRLTRQGVIRRIAIQKRFYTMMPESLALHLNGAQRSYTLETPSEYSLHDRAQTHAAVVDVAIRKVLAERAGG